MPGIVIGAADVRWTGLQSPAVEIVPVDEPGLTDAPATVRTVTPSRVTGHLQRARSPEVLYSLPQR